MRWVSISTSGSRTPLCCAALRNGQTGSEQQIRELAKKLKASAAVRDEVAKSLARSEFCGFVPMTDGS